jgi:peroxiredoxin
VTLRPGDRVPDARVWTTPNESATIAEIAAQGAMLLLFYLFDWSST